MANISEANGKMIFIGKNEEDVDFLYGILQLTDGWYYGIHPNAALDETEVEDTKEVVDEIFVEALNDEEINLPFSLVVPITGEGRWDFRSSLSFLGKWLEDDLVNSKEKLWRVDLPEDFKKKLESKTFVLGFKVSDFEPGCEILERVSVLLLHEAGSSISKMKRIFEDSEGFAVTRENMKDILGWDDEAIECYFEDMEDDE